MFTYFIIGIIVQLVIIAERTIRFPELWSSGAQRFWYFWLYLLAYVFLNVLLWPLAIVCEAYAIIKGY